MATATADNTKATPTPEAPEAAFVPESVEVPEAAQKIREQLLSTVRQGQQLSIDAAQGWAKAVAAFPVPDLPQIPGVLAVPSFETATRFTFDVATDLLDNQRDFALKLTNVLAHAKTS